MEYSANTINNSNNIGNKGSVNEFTNIDDLPVNPQKSGQQPQMVMDPVNKINQNNAIQDCLEFPEEFKTDLTNVVIDEKATPTYSAEKEQIIEEKKVKFNLPEQNEIYDESKFMNNLYVNKLGEKYNSLTPLMQLIVLSSILYFILSNPLVQEFMIKTINGLNLIKVTNIDGNMNINGKILFAFIFGFSLFTLIQFIHSSSIQIVF